MSHPGSNDPSTAYLTSGGGDLPGAGGGGGGVPTLNVDLADGNDNPVLSFADAGHQTRMSVIITGKDGEASESDVVLAAAPATAKMLAGNNGSTVMARLLLAVEDDNGDTQSTVVSHAETSGAYLRVTANDAQTSAAVEVSTPNDGLKVSIFPTGDVESHVPGAGVVLQSPNGTRYRIVVANDGTVSAAAA